MYAKSIPVYEDFIKKYPDGKYTEQAKTNLAKLKEEEAARIKLKAEKEAKIREEEAKEAAADKAYQEQTMTRNKEIGYYDVPEISDNNVVSNEEMKKIKKDLESIMKPVTFKELYDIATSKDIPNGGDKGRTTWNEDKTKVFFLYATVGEKVEVVSSINGLLNIELSMNGFMTIFHQKYFKDYAPQSIITVFKPSVNEPTGLLFEKIVIWETYSHAKSKYVFKEGKWYQLKSK